MNNFITCKDLVKDYYAQYDASHDFSHIERVLKNAKEITNRMDETVHEEILMIAILLHDVSDKKYVTNGKENENLLLSKLDLTPAEKQWIQEIIESISFNGGNESEATTVEAKIARDADRLDAIGAIGIARTFAYGGAKGRTIYNWDEETRDNMTEEEYRSKQTSSVTHFYEKLLKLKDLMCTIPGAELAEQRHQFMVDFLSQLENETRDTHESINHS